ncbi:tumor necrosis factor receptor superfamily member 1B isoform X2 [Labeo rohita]|uniref:tumor necrosis factor receptor superfamily member 1B isoform X2 n=1 Tax=Labeo rohita TaxID=84645 RepID=UPI0021E2328A|nr:tumor necrosis factor receptor superfamily member 1B isoform X2 [Labeo rohita]
MSPSTSTRNTFILLFYLFFTCLHVIVIGNTCGTNYYKKPNQTVPRCERCTQECSDAKNEMEVTSCTQDTNRVCHCKPGFYCTKGNDYNTHCHKPCVPCEKGTFSSTPSLSTCKSHRDCAKLGMIMLMEGTVTEDSKCVKITTATSTLSTTTDNIIITSTSNSTSGIHIIGTGVTAQLTNVPESQSHWLLLLILMLIILFMAGFCMLMKDVTKKTLSKCFGFIKGGHVSTFV